MLQNSDLFLNAVEKDSLDLAFQSSGIDQCVCGNIFGPRIRRYYLIHFVLDGFGVLQIEEKKYPVKPGQAFLIPAGVNAAYQADFRHPWKYCWIGYQGTQAGYLLGLDSDTFYIYHVAAVMVDNLRRLLLGINLSDKAIMDFDFPGVGFPV